MQNSLDQRMDGQGATIRFSIHRLRGSNRQQFNQAINWTQLEPHIRAVATGRASVMARRLEQALQDLEDEPLTVLRIDDSGTRGLIGGENEAGKNFNALCRNVLDTAEDRPLRGGSFGLGKSVLWRFSSVSTVLFSSRLGHADPKSGFRLFGRAELPHHSTGTDNWSGPGWLGQPEQTLQGLRAVSVWDEDAVPAAEPAQLFRPAQLGSGTTLVVVGFFEPGEEEPRPLSTVAAEILQSATRWFWPSICSNTGDLQVDVEAFDNNERVYSQSAGPVPDVSPFMNTVKATTIHSSVSEQGSVAEKRLSFRIPARRPMGQNSAEPEIDGELRLLLRLATPDDSSSLDNRVALMRGSGMVVDYHRPSRTPLENQTYHAVLLGGLACGESDSDRAVEQFLRASEPPSHNQWMAGTDRIQSEYRQGAKVRFQRLWSDVDRAIVELCEQKVPPATQGPGRLARLFPLRGRGGGASGASFFRVDRLAAHLDDSTWHVSGRVVKRENNNRDWSFQVILWLDAETGRGEPVHLRSLETNRGEVQSQGESWECLLPGSEREVEFFGESKSGAGPHDSVQIRRSRVRLEVRPRMGIGRA